jgi:hypothetical protein
LKKGLTMAQPGTAGQTRGKERAGDEEFLRDEIRPRLEEARESVGEAVSEIKEAAVQGYASVKDAVADFDWRDEVKKRPVAWSLGALGIGLLAGCAISAATKRAHDGEGNRRYVPSEPHANAAHPIIGEVHHSATERPPASARVVSEKQRAPATIEKAKERGASDRVRHELGSLRDRFIDEVSTIAHQVLLPALIRKIREAISTNVSDKRTSGTQPRVPPSVRTT